MISSLIFFSFYLIYDHFVYDTDNDLIVFFFFGVFIKQIKGLTCKERT